MIAAIVCADKNWGIGYNGDLLVKIPEDMKHFKELTMGETVIMGRKTYDSLPVKPLPNRENIVITRTLNNSDCYCYTLEQTKNVLNFVINCDDTVKINNMFIIGGGQIYKELLPYCEKVYVTEIDHEFENVDTYFPNLDEMPDWWLIERSEEKEYNGIKYRFSVYERVNYEIIEVKLDYDNYREFIKVRLNDDDVVHNIEIKYYFHGSESVRLKTFTIPALCCKKNFEKFLVSVQLFKQNNFKMVA